MKRIIAGLGIVLGMLLCATPAAAGIVVNFTPSSQHVDLGDAVKVDVSIAGLGAEILSGYDLNFQYNAKILNWVKIDESGALNELGPDPFVSNDDPLLEGDLGMFAAAMADDATLASSQSDDFLLFSFLFRGIDHGVTTFGLGSDPYFERNFVGLNFETLLVDVGSACIAVGRGECKVLPEPSSYALFGLGLIAAFVPTALRRRKMR